MFNWCLLLIIHSADMVNELNKLNAQDFTVRFSQKKSEVNKIDIPEG